MAVLKLFQVRTNMLHNSVSDDNSGDHWAVGTDSSHYAGKPCRVLVQLQSEGEQVRLALSPKHAEDMARELLLKANKARAATLVAPT